MRVFIRIQGLAQLLRWYVATVPMQPTLDLMRALTQVYKCCQCGYLRPSDKRGWVRHPTVAANTTMLVGLYHVSTLDIALGYIFWAQCSSDGRATVQFTHRGLLKGVQSNHFDFFYP